MRHNEPSSARTSRTRSRTAARWLRQLRGPAWIVATSIACAGGTAFAGEVTLSWVPPSMRTDGSPLTDLTSYRAYWGCGEIGYPFSVTLPATETSRRIEGLPDGATCRFVVTAIDSAGRESDPSNEAVKFFPPVPVADPTSGPVISWVAHLPTANLNADWSADIESGGKFPNDGVDWIGRTSGPHRTAVQFDISSIPADATIDQVGISINVVGTDGGSTVTWIVGPYNGNGQGSPESDSTANAFSRSNVASDNYLTGITSFRTTGLKTFPDLGSAAAADLEAARDAGTLFSVAFVQTGEATSHIVEVDEYTSGNPPVLTVQYTEAGGSVGLGPIAYHHRRTFGMN